MTLNDYQEKAMVTCLPSCKNDVYAINGLTAEVGEINDKVAKWVRKGICRIESNHIVFNTSSEEEVAEYRKELAKEVGDVLWLVAHLSRQLGYTLDDVAKMNIEKLRDRAMRNVIIGEGDNR
jgi:NTP pyrophosphatase (non-canonical NTP hydrolase)